MPKAVSFAIASVLAVANASASARLGIGSTGQVLTVASGIPSWATPATPTSGLTLIKRATTTGAANTGTTYDGVFTSTYKAYKIVIESWILQQVRMTHYSNCATLDQLPKIL